MKQYKADVIVAGGGPAGICGAAAAARAGADTILLERWPVIGGQAVMAKVNMWHTSDRKKEVIRGMTAEFVERLKKYDAIQIHPDFPGRYETYVFNPEYFLLVSEEMLKDAGVTVLCGTPCVDVNREGNRLRSVRIGTKQGLREVEGAVFIDATGSADIAAFSGDATVTGRESDGKVQGMTLMSGFRGLDPAKKEEILARHPGIEKEMKELVRQGKLPAFGPHWFGNDFMWRWPGSLIACTAGNPLDPEDLTRAEMKAREKLPVFLEYFRENFPGCADLELSYTAPWLGIRESRRIIGKYVFTGDDVINRRTFDDAVGHGFWMVDIHDPEGTGYTTWSNQKIHPEPGTSYHIPYRILLSKTIENLMAAGRCASADHHGMAGLRVQSHCHVMGQAAGTAAALSLSENRLPRDLNTELLKKTLINNGVYLEQ